MSAGRPPFSAQEFRDHLADCLEIGLSQPSVPPLIVTDENLKNSAEMRMATLDLLRKGLISGSADHWNEMRETADATRSAFLGGVPELAREPLRSLGIHPKRPVRGVSGGHDESVVVGTVTHFRSHDKIILLSADYKDKKPLGLPRLLREHVEPYLSEHHRGRFSLTALFRPQETPARDYFRRVIQFITEGRIVPGYSEYVF